MHSSDGAAQHVHPRPRRPLPAPKLLIFDLDGTLVDSLRDVAESLNACLELLGAPDHPIEHYRYMVGEGLPVLCRRAVGQSHPHLVDRLLELARPLYRTRLIEHTRPYAGVAELIAALKARSIPLAVLSNKPHDLTVRVVEAFWPGDVFAPVVGYMEEVGRKPSPVGLQRIASVVGVSPAETWMIGDTPTDIETARAAGAASIGVTWGFRPVGDLIAAGVDCVVDQPDEIVALIDTGGDPGITPS